MQANVLNDIMLMDVHLDLMFFEFRYSCISATVVINTKTRFFNNVPRGENMNTSPKQPHDVTGVYSSI